MQTLEQFWYGKLNIADFGIAVDSNKEELFVTTTVNHAFVDSTGTCFGNVKAYQMS